MAGCSNCYSETKYAYNSIKILTNPVVLLPTLFMAVEKYDDLTWEKTVSKSKALRTAGAIGLLGVAIAGAIDLCLNYKMSKDLKQQYTRTTYDLLVEAASKKGSAGGERITYPEKQQIEEILNAKESIFSRLKPASKERYDMENFYYGLIESFSSPGSDGGERINYTEECQVREMCYERMKELGYL